MIFEDQKLRRNFPLLVKQNLKALLDGDQNLKLMKKLFNQTEI